MILSKSSNYPNSISLTEKEASALNAGVYTDLDFTYYGSSMRLPISAVSEPVQIPLTDSNGKFKGFSDYYVAKIKINQSPVKIFTKEEIEALNSQR